MDELSSKFDGLGYDPLGLENLVYLNIDDSPHGSDPGCTVMCKEYCYTCMLGCSSGGK